MQFDPLEQLRQLASLKEQGIVSSDEFAQVKAELLAKVAGTPISRSVPEGSLQTELEQPDSLPQPVVQVRKISPGDVQSAKDRWQKSEAECQSLELEQRVRGRRIKRLQFRLWFLNLQLKCRELVQNMPFGAGGPLIISTCAGVLLGVLLAGIFFTTSTGVMLLTGTIVGMFSLCLAVNLFAMPSQTTINRGIDSAAEETRRLEGLIQHDRPGELQAKQECDNYRKAYELILAEFQSHRNVLLNMEWRALRGIPFEFFLRDVFDQLGFQTRMTKIAGDQGIDLIAEKNGHRLAVQAKGYADRVGNSAIQQAHTGMAYYKCHRCAVITNSTFTPSAKELAQQIGCLLIDSSQINALIFGKIEL